MAKILILDNDQNLCKTTTTFLCKKGYEVDAVENVTTNGLVTLQQKDYGLVFIDMILYSESPELMEYIQNKFPNIQIILLSQEAQAIEKIVKVMPYDCLIKPIDEIALLTVVRQALKMKSLLAENDRVAEENHLYRQNLEKLVEKRSKELRESEEKFRNLFETMAQGVTYQDAHGEIISANPSAERILGLTLQQMQGRTSFDPRWKAIKEDGSDFLGDAHPSMLALKAGVEVNNVVMGVYNPQGNNYRWININAVPIFKPGEKNPYQVYTTFEDITDRKNAVEEISKNEAQLQKIFDILPIGLWFADKTGKLLKGNPAGKKIWGAEPLVGIEEYGVFKARRLPSGVEIAPEDWALAHSVNKGLTITDEMLEIETFDGKQKTILNYTAPVLDEKGMIQGAIVVNHDITEQKIAQDDLKKAEEKLRKQKAVLLSLMSKGVWLKDNLKSAVSEITEACSELIQTERVSVWWYNEDYTYIECFDVYFRSTGLHSQGEKLKSANFPDYVNSHLQGKVIATEDVYTDPRSQNVPYSYHQKHRIVSILDSPIWLQDRVGGILSIESIGEKRSWTEDDERLSMTMAALLSLCVEAAERKRAVEELHNLNLQLEERVKERTKQLEESNKEMEAFSYSVSHDLRSPLRAVTGFTRIILEDYAEKLGTEGQRLLNIVCSNTTHMDRLITDLLELSRTTSAEIKAKHINMTELVWSAYQKTCSPDIRDTFAFQLTPIPDATGDPSLLHQVWQNLLSNAVKYSMPKDSRTIQVGGYCEENRTIYFVKDTGVGFNPKYSHKLFGVFQRLHKSEDFEGTGIGLAIVHRIVTRMGGQVWAEGELNMGATFYFSLPLKGGMVSEQPK